MLEPYVALNDSLLMFRLENCMAISCKKGALLLLLRESKLLFSRKHINILMGNILYVHQLYNPDCIIHLSLVQEVD